MKKTKIKSTNYLFSSARIKSIEQRLLSRDKLERISEAESPKDALKLLGEFGWPEMADPSMEAVEEALTEYRQGAFALVQDMAPEKEIVDIFRLKYDYHNLKTLLRSEVTGENPDDLLIDSGIFPGRRLKAMLQDNRFQSMSEQMARCIGESRDVLARTQDPQLMDMVLDKAMLADMLEMADSLHFDFLKGYVALLIDSLNLRTYIRLRRMDKEAQLFRYALIPGGAVPVTRLLEEASEDALESVFYHSPLIGAAHTGLLALQGEETLHALDLACDNALLKYVKAARHIAFGAEPLIGYLVAVEAEVRSVRTVMAGQIARLPAETITERLRETYV